MASTAYGRRLGGYAAITASTTQTQAGGTAVTAGVTAVTTANLNDAITLPADVAVGDSLVITNVSANACGVFPPSGGKINGGTTDAVKALAANMSGLYVSLGSNNWAAVLSA